jgi:hypothetical protein
VCNGPFAVQCGHDVCSACAHPYCAMMSTLSQGTGAAGQPGSWTFSALPQPGGRKRKASADQAAIFCALHCRAAAKAKRRHSGHEKRRHHDHGSASPGRKRRRRTKRGSDASVAGAGPSRVRASTREGKMPRTLEPPDEEAGFRAGAAWDEDDEDVRGGDADVEEGGGEGERPGDEDDRACDVCGDKESFQDDMIVFCDGCDVAVHQLCYGVKVRTRRGPNPARA